MRKFRPLILVLLLIAGVLLYFWTPWKTKQQTVDFANAGELVKASQGKSLSLKNYRYKTNVSVGNQIKVAIHNRVVREKDLRQMVDFSWDIPKMSGMASMYAEGQKMYIFHPLKDKWLLPSEEPTLSPFIDFFWRQLALVDSVENILKVDAADKNISIYDDGSDEGSDTIAVQVIPKPSALSEINKALPPQFAGAELTGVKQIFWISKKDLLVTRYEVRANVSFFGFKTMDFLTVTIPSDYDKTSIKLSKALLDKMGNT